MAAITLGDALALAAVLLSAGGLLVQVRTLAAEVREMRDDMKAHFAADAKIAERVAVVEAVVDRETTDRIGLGSRRRREPARS